MVSYNQILTQNNLKEEELPEEIKGFIRKYKGCMIEADAIQNSKKLEYFNSRKGEMTQKGKDVLSSATEHANDYNERIVDLLSDYIDDIEDEKRRQLEADALAKEKKGDAQPPIEPQDNEPNKDKPSNFWWA